MDNQNNDDKNTLQVTIAQIIPVVITYFMLAETDRMVAFSHTILGKLLAICVIIFYSNMDPILGLFVCLLIIYFYQHENISNIKTLNISTWKKIIT